MRLESLFIDNAPLITALALVVIPIKGYALWTSARRNEKWWFIALLIINTLAILELIYLFGFAKVHEKWDTGKKDATAPEKKTPDAPTETK